ncbi:hypothetical protein Pcinc_021252 [Petrolisthes cinctipes]|uniref:tRNA (32-2'-O)-methyltransferase regulator THADA n=1 Tax=Petrolisthes cinctipes TaxID=88211 RepID=A0AAE1KK37_PETCI|nr:hypothetical protein Pcinc_021252 [Petrolisthes cinctipes]
MECVPVLGKQTLKGGKIRKSHMEKFTIDSPPDTAEDEIHQAYKELVHPQSPLEQIGAIEKVADLALHCEECASVCIGLLLSSLLQLKPKVPLRNKILKCLPTIKSTRRRVYQDAVMRILRNTLSHTDDSTSLLQGVVMLSENMDHLLIIDLPAKDLVAGESRAANSVIMELHFLMSRAMLQGLNLLWEKCLKESSAVETSSTLQQIQQLVKSSTWYLQHHYSKSAVHSDVTMEAERLLETVLGVICHPTCPLDLRVNCGQLVAVLHRILTFGEMDSLVQQVVDRVGQFTYLPNVAQLSIMNGILCITPGKSLYITQRDVVLGVEILQAAVSPSYMSSDGIVALSAIRLIQQWTLRTLEALQSANETTVALKSALDFNSPLMTNFREYLWLAWDHFLDSVKHSARETFMNLIKIHNIIDEQQSKYNFLYICKTFLRQLNSQKFKCSAVSCMVSVVGSKCLLELYPTLPHDLLHFMKDPAMASHSAELLEALFTQHQREVSLTEWQSVWLSSFIDLFSKEMQAFGVTSQSPPVRQHLVKSTKKLFQRIRDGLITLIKLMVRNSSPEGHLPMDLNPESLESLQAALQESLGIQQFQGDVSLTQNSGLDELVKAQAVSAQMLLLCAWRCVKEVSLILGNLLQDMPLFPSPCAMLSVTNVRNIGQYFLTQLFETKHRGAFEQSYVGFGRVCERLWKCEDEQLRKLPEEWLTQVMTLIQDDCDTKLCATRRSAGVPFIVQAVLSSEPNIHQAACLSKTMTVLLTLAREPQYDGSEARIHAFNILRSVYRDTRLGDLIIPFVSEGVKAAIRGYKSKLWAERNAATLLFAALVTRMLGVKQTQDDLSRKNTVSALVFFRRYPDLFDFLKDELQTGARGIIEGKLVPALFPVLLLLARLAPAPVEGRTSSVSLAMFTPGILQCASSSVLQLRALTSHALVPLVPPSEFQSVVGQLCSKASLTNQNDLHGRLLCLLKLFKNFPENASLDLKKIVECILSISWAATKSNCCLVTRSCALELFTVLCVQHLLPKTSPELKIMSKDSLSLVLENDSAVNVQPWSTYCKKHAVEFLLECIPVENLKTQSLSYYLFTNSCYEVRECVLENTHKLPDLPIEMFMLLMARMMSGEENVKCLTLVYQNLYKLILRPEVCSEVTEENFSSIVKLTLSEVRQDTCIELRDAVIQLGSLALHSLLSRNQTELLKEQLSAWVLVLMKWCGSEHGDGTRLVVAEGVAGILPFLHSHPSVSGETRQQLLETVVYELQDDWSQVRERAAKGATALLTCFSNTMHPSLHPARILPKFCDFIGSTGTSESLTLLVTLALKEDLSQGFGLSQNDDRLFDKGEMNIFSENLFVARTAAQSLGTVLSEWSPSEEPPMFLRQSILPYLCSLAAQQSEGSETMEAIYNESVYAAIDEPDDPVPVPSSLLRVEPQLHESIPIAKVSHPSDLPRERPLYYFQLLDVAPLLRRPQLAAVVQQGLY